MPEQKKHILFVDDDPAVLSTMERSLHKVKEWKCHFASSVDVALQFIRREAIDVIISDYTMPNRDGLSLLKELKNDSYTSGIPFIMLTGNGEDDLKSRALQAGAIDLLNKPTSTDEIITRISNVLALKAYEDQLKKQNVHLEQEVDERTKELDFLHKDLILRLARAGEFRDKNTGNHVVRVAYYCKVLATSLELNEDDVNAIFLASTLHDLGKIAIPDSILLKEGKLSELEFEIMKSHALIGAEILKDDSQELKVMMKEVGATTVDFFDDSLRNCASEIASTHHERWDGTGYPNGLQGDAIPLFGQIVSIADVYDALRSKRPYKEPYSKERSVKIIEEGRGTHFSPQLVDHFIACIDQIEDILLNYKA